MSALDAVRRAQREVADAQGKLEDAVSHFLVRANPGDPANDGLYTAFAALAVARASLRTREADARRAGQGIHAQVQPTAAEAST